MMKTKIEVVVIPKKKQYSVGFLTFMGLLLLMSFDQATDLRSSMARGKRLYTVNCANCHMAQGEGLEKIFPPLVNSQNLADKKAMVGSIVNGMSGPMEVNGIRYNGSMPAYPFSDQETADVLNYVRNSWGNQYGAMSPGEVQTILKSE